MQIVVLANKTLKEELLITASSLQEEIIWIEDPSQFHNYDEASAFIDLLFEKNHVDTLIKLLPKLVIINSVEETLSETNPSFIRMNGWPTFLKSSLIEASCLNENNKQKTEELFLFFNKKIEWVDDLVGFISPRVISMIINEAFIAVKEGVSSKEEIDTAMKLGTNYPYGPFEWAEKIGVEKVKSLLEKLSREQERYRSFVS